MTITAYLNERSIPVLTGKQSQTCEGPILENELLKTLKICQITSHSEMMAELKNSMKRLGRLEKTFVCQYYKSFS